MAQQKRFVNAESLKLVVCGSPASSHSVIKVLTGKTKASHGKKADFSSQVRGTWLFICFNRIMNARNYSTGTVSVHSPPQEHQNRDHKHKAAQRYTIAIYIYGYIVE
jgi:hypothetical protein